MRLAESMVTPETECLLYATYWFRPILSELLGTAKESAELNKNRAPSGPVKVLVTDRQHKRLTGIVDVFSGASSLLAWFPASWASKIAPHFLANPTENGQRPQIINIACPKRAGSDAPMDGEKQTLQAIRFAAKNMPFLDLAIDEDLRDANCFAELMHGYTEGLVEPNMMRGLQPVGPGRTTLEVIIPSQSGLSPAKWKETATLCPLDWPSNYSLLRLWHINGSLQKTESRLRQQTEHSHMFASWTVHYQMFAERVLFRRPAIFAAKTALQANIRDSAFPDRRLRPRAPPAALAAHQAALTALHQHAANHQQTHPVLFELPNEWIATVTSDKQHYREHFMKGMTGSNT